MICNHLWPWLWNAIDAHNYSFDQNWLWVVLFRLCNHLVVIILTIHLYVVSLTPISCLFFMAMMIFRGFDGFVVMTCMVFGGFDDVLVLGGSTLFVNF